MTPSQQRALYLAAAEAEGYFADQLARNPNLERAKHIHQALQRVLRFRAPRQIRRSEKACSRCEQVRVIEDFALDADAIDGHQRWCKACTNQYRKDQRGPEGPHWDGRRVQQAAILK